MKNGLLDFLQSASNAVAGNVAGPVDLLGMGLNKIGVPVGAAPVGGTEWMKRQGLMRDVQQGPARVLGETAGLLGPALATQFAPQIAKGLLQAADNMAAPQALNKQAGMILYHGSGSNKPIRRIEDAGSFGGLFASGREGAASAHGDNVYRMTIPDESIMRGYDDAPWDVAQSTVSKSLKGHPLADDIADMALSNKGILDLPDDEAGAVMSALKETDWADADWKLQYLRGQIAKNAGFKAVEMPDEHGISYLVLPGTTPRPYSQSAKQLARKK